MKFVIFFVLVALALSAQALSDEDKQQWKQFMIECHTSTGVDKELIQKARSKEYTGRDSKLASYFSCIFEKLDVQETDGQFKIDALVDVGAKLVDKGQADKIVKKCAVFDAAQTKDDNSMNFIYCFYKSLDEGFKLNL